MMKPVLYMHRNKRLASAHNDAQGPSEEEEWEAMEGM